MLSKPSKIIVFDIVIKGRSSVGKKTDDAAMCFPQVQFTPAYRTKQMGDLMVKRCEIREHFYWSLASTLIFQIKMIIFNSLG